METHTVVQWCKTKTVNEMRTRRFVCCFGFIDTCVFLGAIGVLGSCLILLSWEQGIAGETGRRGTGRESSNNFVSDPEAEANKNLLERCHWTWTEILQRISTLQISLKIQFPHPSWRFSSCVHKRDMQRKILCSLQHIETQLFRLITADAFENRWTAAQLSEEKTHKETPCCVGKPAAFTQLFPSFWVRKTVRIPEQIKRTAATRLHNEIWTPQDKKGKKKKFKN